jgi:LmbE family N-acetylglucosaminyl deacetylase
LSTEPHRILASLAHPDDESFGPGGTLALYAQQQVEVHLLCATNGDVGTVEPDLMRGYDSIAKLRLAELDCAGQALGLAKIHTLGYRDSGMPGSTDNEHPQALAAAPLEKVEEQVVSIIRQVRPQVVITFDPIGGYFHPDHIRIHEATRLAFQSAGDPTRYPDAGEPYQPQKLYYHTFSRRWLRMLVRIMPLWGMDPSRWGRNNDIDLTTMVKHDFGVDAKIDVRPALEAKRQATACHKSQTDDDGGPGFLLTWLRRLGMGSETFMRAFPETPNGKVERDLFRGIGDPDSMAKSRRSRSS